MTQKYDKNHNSPNEVVKQIEISDTSTIVLNRLSSCICTSQERTMKVRKGKYIPEHQHFAILKEHRKAIILKDITGSGLTTNFLSKKNRAYILEKYGKQTLMLCSSTAQVKGKANGAKTKDGVDYCCEGLTKITQVNANHSIMTTYNSWCILKKTNPELARQISRTHILVVDEYHSLCSRTGFTPEEVELLRDTVDTFEYAYLGSATEDKWSGYFSHLPAVQLKSTITTPLKVDLVREYSRKAVAKRIMELAYLGQHVLLFSNDSSWLTLLQSDIDVMCANGGSYKLKAILYTNAKSSKGERNDFSKFNYDYNIHLVSAKGFEGVDFDRDAHVFVHSSWKGENNIATNICDAYLKQIIGRIRKELLSATVLCKITESGKRYIEGLAKKTPEQLKEDFQKLPAHKRQAIGGYLELAEGKTFDGGEFVDYDHSKIDLRKSPKETTSNKNCDLSTRTQNLFIEEKLNIGRLYSLPSFLDENSPTPYTALFEDASANIANHFGFGEEYCLMAQYTTKAVDLMRFVAFCLYPSLSRGEYLKPNEKLNRAFTLLSTNNKELKAQYKKDKQKLVYRIRKDDESKNEYEQALEDRNADHDFELNQQCKVFNKRCNDLINTVHTKLESFHFTPFNLDVIKAPNVSKTTCRDTVNFSAEKAKSNFSEEQKNLFFAIQFFALFDLAYCTRADVPELSHLNTVRIAEIRAERKKYMIKTKAIGDKRTEYVIISIDADSEISLGTLNKQIKRESKKGAEKILAIAITNLVNRRVKRVMNGVFLGLNGIVLEKEMNENREYNHLAMSVRRYRALTSLNFAEMDINRFAPEVVSQLLKNSLGDESTLHSNIDSIYDIKGKTRKQAKKFVNTVFNKHGDNLKISDLMALGMTASEANFFKDKFNKKGAFFTFYTELEAQVINKLRKDSNTPSIRIHDCLMTMGEKPATHQIVNIEEYTFNLSSEHKEFKRGEECFFFVGDEVKTLDTADRYVLIDRAEQREGELKLYSGRMEIDPYRVLTSKIHPKNLLERDKCASALQELHSNVFEMDQSQVQQAI